MTNRRARIGLGTVQWGLEYGVNSNQTIPSREEIARILDVGRAAGIRMLDTAALYGEAELALGCQDLDRMCIVTKTPRYAHAPITVEDAEDLKSTFARSLLRLRQLSVYGLLVHHANDLFELGGDLLIKALLSLREMGLVSRIGVSVYNGAQIKAVLERFRPDIVQLPLSVFDQRLIVDGSIARLAELGIEIHVRSAFLQGLLLMPPDRLPAYFAPWREKLFAWHHECASQKVTPQQAALAFVCDRPEITCCFIGVHSQAQLIEALDRLDAVTPFDSSNFASADPALVNPMNWKLL